MLYTENRSCGNHTCSVSCQRKQLVAYTNELRYLLEDDDKALS